MIMRRIARPLLAAAFVSGGIESLRNPKPRIQAAEPLVDKAVDQVKDKLPDQISTDAESLVKIDAAVKIGAGLALALGKFPRLAALLLAGTVIPTTAAGHRFWECEDLQERAAQQVHFFKNLGLLGGLMLAAGDTHGKPSAAWRAKHAASVAAGTVQGSTAAAAGKVSKLADTASGKVQEAAGSVKGAAKGSAKGVRAAKGTVTAILPG
jgi:uncharacterized membrane protein YphA (DoxX/SURF4 family)